MWDLLTQHTRTITANRRRARHVLTMSKCGARGVRHKGKGSFQNFPTSFTKLPYFISKHGGFATGGVPFPAMREGRVTEVPGLGTLPWANVFLCLDGKFLRPPDRIVARGEWVLGPLSHIDGPLGPGIWPPCAKVMEVV